MVVVGGGGGGGGRCQEPPRFLRSQIHCIHNKNEAPSLLSITYNTIHPWPRKETELSNRVVSQDKLT